MTIDAIVTTVRSADGTPIAFERAGHGPIVIFVDPALGYRGFRRMGPVAELLASEFTVYTYDRRGRGESGDTAPYAVEREIEDLAAVITEAGGSAFVFGYSSGALLGLLAAAAGHVIPKLALFEPPIQIDDNSSTSRDNSATEIAELVAAGRRGDAVENFMKAIGVPSEMISGMREAPFWPAVEAVAHTLPYEFAVSDATSVDDVAAVTAPTLVIDSQGSSANLTASANAVVEALPNGRHRSLEGEWHDVPAEDVAVVVAEFFRE